MDKIIVKKEVSINKESSVKRNSFEHLFAPKGLYRSAYEHDSCGTGFVARISGEPSHDIVAMAVEKAVDEARKIDEASMAKHNRDATIISMILGFTALALFVDGLLRILGIIPPFMDIDVNVIDDIIDKVESDILPLVQKIPRRNF